MKDQYFGDVNDYRKYGLLRILSLAGRMRLGVCWMLTAPDSRSDGGKTGYLCHPERWRHFDPELFDFLHGAVINGAHDVQRSVTILESAGLLGSSEFYRTTITDQSCQRQCYFEEMLCQFQQSDLVFFDPDNGMEVPSIVRGHRNSSKYLFWDELYAVFRRGHSVLVYQHFTRERRADYLNRLVAESYRHTSCAALFSFLTPHVAFILLSQARHAAYFDDRIEAVKNSAWGERDTSRRCEITGDRQILANSHRVPTGDTLQ